MNNKESTFTKMHQPCWCGDGSDNTGVNDDGSAWCFACSKRVVNYKEAMSAGEINTKPEINKEQPYNSLINTAVYKAIPDRKISIDTCIKYGVKVIGGQNDSIISHCYPYYDESNNPTATKTRVVANKSFFISGTIAPAALFGRSLFKGGGKYITITEGEIDALSAYQMFGSKWPVVSLRNGASGAVKDIKHSIEYLESFDNIVLCFDNDKPGKEAAAKVAKLIKPGKCRIIKLPDGFKDASDMLVSNKSNEFVSAFWNAELYRPAGILNISDMEDSFFEEDTTVSIPFPWEGLNKKMYGMRRKELLTLTGGTGLGKSSVTRELEAYLMEKTKDNIGIIALEEDWKRTATGILEIKANVRLSIKEIGNTFPKEEFKRLYNMTFKGENKDRLYVHAHVGIQDIDETFSKLRYLIVGCDCKWVIVDHLHMLVAGHTDGDERRNIDDIMLRLRSLVEETGCGMVLVSHLKRTNSDKGHEQGIEVSLSHLRGSQSIAQLSDSVIALERNQQSENPEVANTTVLRVLKCRYTGDAGVACILKYDKLTGRLTEIDQDINEFSVESEY